MRVVVQRVLSASVIVDNEIVSQISRCLMILVGIGGDDTSADIDVLSKKILTLRVFEDAAGSMWKANVKDVGGEILCVSQFTLMANTSKGNKPDFHRAMPSDQSRAMYISFLDKMRSLYPADKIKDGRFGAMMNVSLTNEGPVTFTLDSRKFEYVAPSLSTLDKRKAARGTLHRSQPPPSSLTSEAPPAFAPEAEPESVEPQNRGNAP